MNRILFESSELAADGRATFGGVRAEHVRTILHGEVGQTLKTGVVDGPIGTGVIERIDGETVTVRCVHDREALPPWIDLVLAPPRPRVMKRLLPQLAAMGVGRIVLVGAAKVEKAFWGAQLLKEEVYRPLLVDGLMQAGTTALPTIQLERGFGRWLEGGRFEEQFAGQPDRIVAHPDPQATSHEPRTTNRPVLAIGPEGGWTDDEVARLEAHGFRRMSLGPRILRTDTATIALLARLMPSPLSHGAPHPCEGRH